MDRSQKRVQKKEQKRLRKIQAREEFKVQWEEHRALTIVYFILRFAVIGIAIAQFFNGNYSNFFLCILTLFLFLIPSFVEKKIKVDVPDTLEIIILLFIFSAEILGEIREYYITFPYWDTMLHTLNGFLMAAIGFSLIDILNESKKFSFSLSPLFVAMVAFCFSMTIGVLWEFFEFGMDMLFATDMQKDTFVSVVNTVLLNPNGRNIAVSIPIESVVVNGEAWPAYIDIGIIDTMKDLFVNFIGAVVFSFLGIFYLKGRKREKFNEKFLLTKIGPEEEGEKQSSSIKEDGEEVKAPPEA